jgi:hypothetical protein
MALGKIRKEVFLLGNFGILKGWRGVNGKPLRNIER